MQRGNFNEWEKNHLKDWFFKGVDSLKVNTNLSNLELEIIFDDEFEKYYHGKE